MASREMELAFPSLAGTSYSQESPATDVYNCIAFAFCDTQNWWWPQAGPGVYWPVGFPLSDQVQVLVAIFEAHGYSVCSDCESEAHYEKVAIYSVQGRFKHAARQLRSGRWASKLGEGHDIEHERAEHLDSMIYGSAEQFLRRLRTDWL